MADSILSAHRFSVCHECLRLLRALVSGHPQPPAPWITVWAGRDRPPRSQRRLRRTELSVTGLIIAPPFADTMRRKICCSSAAPPRHSLAGPRPILAKNFISDESGIVRRIRSPGKNSAGNGGIRFWQIFFSSSSRGGSGDTEATSPAGLRLGGAWQAMVFECGTSCGVPDRLLLPCILFNVSSNLGKSA